MSERGEYRSIPVVLVRGRDYRALSPAAKLTFLTLKLELGPSGLDVYDLELLPKYTGHTSAECAAACQELREKGWIDFDDVVVWIIRGLEFGGALSVTNSKHRKGLLTHVIGLPTLPVVGKFIAAHREWFDDPDSLSRRFPIPQDSPPIAYPKATDSLPIQGEVRGSRYEGEEEGKKDEEEERSAAAVAATGARGEMDTPSGSGTEKRLTQGSVVTDAQPKDLSTSGDPTPSGQRSSKARGSQCPQWLVPYRTAWEEAFEGDTFDLRDGIAALHHHHIQNGPGEVMRRLRIYLEAHTPLAERRYASIKSFGRRFNEFNQARPKHRQGPTLANAANTGERGFFKRTEIDIPDLDEGAFD